MFHFDDDQTLWKLNYRGTLKKLDSKLPLSFLDTSYKFIMSWKMASGEIQNLSWTEIDLYGEKSKCEKDASRGYLPSSIFQRNSWTET